MNIRALLLKGHAVERPSTHAGKHRVGSTGAVIGSRVYGVCHRKALARLLGYEIPAGVSTKVMWEAGLRNEDTWTKILTQAGATLSQPEVDSNGVTGHPDLIVEYEGEKLGLELKGIFGLSTAESVLAGKPKTENLIQTAVYSMLLDLPFDLCYTSSSYIKFPKGRSIPPFYAIFHTRWADTFEYRQEGTPIWTPTLLTKQSINDYWVLVDEMRAAKDLGPVPVQENLDGTRAKYSPCGLCEFKDACEQYESDKSYSDWINNIKELI
jgi:hypothetical protein